MRILAAGELIPLDKLGLTVHNKERLEKNSHQTLWPVMRVWAHRLGQNHHAVFHPDVFNTPDAKIRAAENPVEITQKGLRQVQINKKDGIDLALVMCSFLRADPYNVMVGESREKNRLSGCGGITVRPHGVLNAAYQFSARVHHPAG